MCADNNQHKPLQCSDGNDKLIRKLWSAHARWLQAKENERVMRDKLLNLLNKGKIDDDLLRSVCVSKHSLDELFQGKQEERLGSILTVSPVQVSSVPFVSNQDETSCVCTEGAHEEEL